MLYIFDYKHIQKTVSHEIGFYCNCYAFKYINYRTRKFYIDFIRDENCYTLLQEHF